MVNLFNLPQLIKFTGVEGVENPEMFIPERKSDGATGYDIKAARVLDKITRKVSGVFPVSIMPNETKLIGVGIYMAVPLYIDCQVRPRSGLATKFDILLANGVGTADPDYRGEIACSLRNFSDVPFTVHYMDRIAQLIFTPVIYPRFNYVKSPDELPPTTRSTGGFGSTGMTSSEGYGTTEYDKIELEKDIYLMKITLVTADRSNCIRGCKKDKNGRPMIDKKGKLIGQTRKLGCVIARGDKIIVSGFNAQYPGSPLCAEVGCLRDELNIPSGTQIEVCRAIHAEEMAILSAARDTVSVLGCTMYVNAEPCESCAKKIAGLGLERLVVLTGGFTSSEGVEIVRQSGTIVTSLNPELL